MDKAGDTRTTPLQVTTAQTSPVQPAPGPSSPNGTFTTTKHDTKQKYGPSNPQCYGCKVCGILCDSHGELNEHHRQNHAPAICPVCKQQFSAPNIRDHHMYTHSPNKQYQFTFDSELG